jgi:hypothetical protein
MVFEGTSFENNWLRVSHNEGYGLDREDKHDK